MLPCPCERETARTELDWWQARREPVGPQSYGVTVARVAALTYGKPADDPAILEFGMARAQAMADRDASGRFITQTDWARIEEELLHAHEALGAALTR